LAWLDVDTMHVDWMRSLAGGMRKMRIYPTDVRTKKQPSQ